MTSISTQINSTTTTQSSTSNVANITNSLTSISTQINSTITTQSSTYNVANITNSLTSISTQINSTTTGQSNIPQSGTNTIVSIVVPLFVLLAFGVSVLFILILTQKKRRLNKWVCLYICMYIHTYICSKHWCIILTLVWLHEFQYNDNNYIPETISINNWFLFLL